MMNDRQLSPHVTLFDLTNTSHAEFQEENRIVNYDEEKKLYLVANLIEAIIIILGGDVDKHSGRRIPALNAAVGGSQNSQHMKCEAVDLSRKGPDTEEQVLSDWQRIATAARVQNAKGYVGTGALRFGQLIFESSKDKREGRNFWIHASLGEPYREKRRCMDVATLIDGKFTRISRIA